MREILRHGTAVGRTYLGSLGSQLTLLNWRKNKTATTEISSLWAAGKSTNASFFLFFPAPPLLSLAILLFSEHAAFSILVRVIK